MRCFFLLAFLLTLRSGAPAQPKSELVLQTAHRIIVTDTQLSPDGSTLATASWDGTVKLWDPKTGEVERTLRCGYDAVNSVAFSPNGRTLLSGSGVPGSHDASDGPGHAQLWDLSDGKALLKLAFVHPVEKVAWSKDGQTFYTVSYRSLPLPKGELPDLNSRNHFASQLQIWNTATGAKIKTLEFPNTFISGLKLSPDGKVLAVGAHAVSPSNQSMSRGNAGLSDIRFLNPATLAFQRKLTTPGLQLSSFAWSPDGKQLATGSDLEDSKGKFGPRRYGAVRLWNVASGKVTALLYNEDDVSPGDVDALAWSGDGKILAASSETMGGRVVLWNTAKRALIRKLTRFRFEQIQSLVFARGAGGKTEVIAGGGYLQHGALQFWDVATGHLDRHIIGRNLHMTSLKLAADGKSFATVLGQVSSGNGQVSAAQVWDVDTAAPKRTIPLVNDVNADFTYSPDGRWLAASGSGEPTYKNGLFLYDAATGKMAGALRDPSIYGIAFSPDSKILAVSGNAPRLYDLTLAGGMLNLKLRPNFKASPNVDAEFVFSPQGDKLLTFAGEDDEPGPISLLNVADGKTLWATTIKGFSATKAVFSPDGKSIAVAGINGNIKLLNAATGWPGLFLAGHHDPIGNLAWGTQLWSAGADGTLRSWNTITGEETAKFDAGSPIVDFAMTADGQSLLALTLDNEVKEWQLKGGKPELFQTWDVLDVKKDAAGKVTIEWLAVKADGTYTESAGAKQWIRWRSG